MVKNASGIEPSPTVGALSGRSEILVNPHLNTTFAAQHRSHVEGIPRPPLDVVGLHLVMAGVASVQTPAASKADGDHVQEATVVRTAALRVQVDAEDPKGGNLGHRGKNIVPRDQGPWPPVSPRTRPITAQAVGSDIAAKTIFTRSPGT